jgi:DNA helicase-2/ATP-dependent DNA helicase PcrA
MRVHLEISRDAAPACGANARGVPLFFTGDPDKVTCASCKRTAIFRREEARSRVGFAACDCAASGNAQKPKQHGADAHAKNCASLIGAPVAQLTPAAAASLAVFEPASPFSEVRAVAPMGTFEVEQRWSAQQEAIFAWFAHPARRGVSNLPLHLVVRARAGTGKTTTILAAIGRAPERRILLAAFNKRIAVELQERLTNSSAEAATLHSIGFRCVRRRWEGIRVDEDGRRGRAAKLTDAVCSPHVPDQVKRLISKLHTVAREIHPHVTAAADLALAAIVFDCVPDDDWVAEGYDTAFVCGRAIEAMELAAATRPIAGIDFADMIYLPVRNGWLRPAYDLVVVDEAQDMSAPQLEIALGMLAPSGRIAIVGDDRQAIYGFRGADTGSLDRLKHELHATELGLNTTYRCGRAIVAEAAKIVPDFLPGAPHEGSVTAADLDRLLATAAVGDFVLSRTNAPLVAVAMALIRAGKRTRIEGRDIGTNLKSIARKLAAGPLLYQGSTGATTPIPVWLDRLREWEDREVARAERADLPGKVDNIRDKARTLVAISEGVTGIHEIEARIDTLFGDVAVDSRGAFIVCSTVHKAKGLESNRVWVLRDTLYLHVSCECGHRHGWGAARCPRCSCAEYRPAAAKQTEEFNIGYVAITRAKRELVWVTGVK